METNISRHTLAEGDQGKKTLLAKTMRFLAIFFLSALVLLGFVALGLSLWVRHSFGFVSVNQALMNLAGAGAGGTGGKTLFLQGVFFGAVVPLSLTIAVVGGFLYTRRRRKAKGKASSVNKLIGAVSVLVIVLVPVAGVASFASVFGVADYVRASRSTADLGQFYVEPEIVNSLDQSGKNATNLVIIYLESIEDAFADTDTFEVDMIEPLYELTSGWDQVANFEQYEGGGWTMSGIVGTQCGIPLQPRPGTVLASGSGTTESMEMNKWGKNQETFLPGAVCLGDVLNDRGYKNVFMGGADSSHAGKKLFLKEHGFDEVLDLEHWKEKGETELREDWGLSDRRLIENAKAEVTRLHEAAEPFHLSVLTVDTHERAFAHDYCDVTTKVPLESITQCSMNQVADFLDFLEAEGYLEDTAVVVMGDHLKFAAEANSFWNELKDREDRTIYNRIWTPNDVQIATDGIDQISMYPTILEVMGLELVDGRAGVGVSAARTDSPSNTIRSLTPEEYKDLITSQSSEFYEKMWRVSE